MYLFERLSAWLNFILFDIHVFCPAFKIRVPHTHCHFDVNAKSKISFMGKNTTSLNSKPKSQVTAAKHFAIPYIIVK